MIKLENISIETLKGRKLIDDLSFSLNKGDKLAIIGEEGNGKSTLLKTIFHRKDVETYCVVNGKVISDSKVFGYLEQKLDARWNNFLVIDYFLKSDLDSEPNYDFYENFHKLENLLKSFNFKIEYLENGQQIKNLSGGEKVKIQLAKILLQQPDVLLLDEPTNDLDIEMLNILQKVINEFNGIVIFISHDEVLLENTANVILHIEQLIRKTKPKTTFKRTSYANYVQERKQHIQHQTQIAYSERREQAKKEEILRQIKQKVENALVASKKDPSAGRIVAKKMANVVSLEKKYENKEMTEIPDVEESINILIDTTITIPKQKEVLKLNIKELKAGDKILANNVNLNIFGPEKIAIIGNNGCGKTTLIKRIVETLKSVKGLKVGYFSQNYYDILDYDMTPIEALTTSNMKYNPRTFLGSLKFTAEEMEHKIFDLSEGQKAKVALLKIVVDKNTILVLDEPTRNLSPLSNPVIRQLFTDYKGGIITVSHDRKFIKDVCSKVYKLDKSGLHSVSIDKL